MKSSPPVFNTSTDGMADLLRKRTEHTSMIPGLALSTVSHRERISAEEKNEFRIKLLRTIRQGWIDDQTEIYDCNLVDQYDRVQLRSGKGAFLHSYVNLATEHDFFLDKDYVAAFSHPLLVALISFLLGRHIRLVDFRGKDNDPISVNAQDNMLHVDNTPFKEEYKVLLTWQRGQSSGPTGQNSTFLPWTHKANRKICTSQDGASWSTERESLFVTHEAIESVFELQRAITGATCVVEAKHGKAPLAILFPAGALVHHRYRTEEGDPRSCIITAYHLSSLHPGQISEFQENKGQKKSLIEFLAGYQDSSSGCEFLEQLSRDSPTIESKLAELFDCSSPGEILDLKPLSLREEALTRWRQAVMSAPSPISHRIGKQLYLSRVDFDDLDDLTKRLAQIMDYDKHCNLQMILYEDGREEIRKPARKIIGEMECHEIEARLKPWTSMVNSSAFEASELLRPRSLMIMCNAMSDVSKHLGDDEITRDQPQRATGQRKMLLSLSRLVLDLGEAVLRCDGIDALIATSLFIFWTAETIYSQMDPAEQSAYHGMLRSMLRNYMAAAMIVEGRSSCHEAQ